jgi:hypothetical protein
MRPGRAWVRLESGRRLDLLEPDPESWADSDLAIGLSRTYRWGGHSCWNLPLSVAQHSLLVLVLRQRLRPFQPLSQPEALRELLRDADEGLLSYDPIHPVKPHHGPDFRALTSRLQTAITTRYAVLPWDKDNYAVHKQADRLAAASEAIHIAGWSHAELQETLEIDIAPLSADPLPLPPGMRPWEPWPARTAAALFLAKLRELTDDRDSGVADPADISSCIERERTIAHLASSFPRLPHRQRHRCRQQPSGDSLTDLLVTVEEIGGSAFVEGLLVDAECDDNGRWDFEAPFTVFTTDEVLVVCPGIDCNVEIQ